MSRQQRTSRKPNGKRRHRSTVTTAQREKRARYRRKKQAESRAASVYAKEQAAERRSAL